MDYNNFNVPGKYSKDKYDSYYHDGDGHDSDDVVSIASWVGILILTAIPFINIIALLVMAFGGGNQNIKNYGKASLIIAGGGLILAFLFGACSAF